MAERIFLEVGNGPPPRVSLKLEGFIRILRILLPPCSEPFFTDSGKSHGRTKTTALLGWPQTQLTLLYSFTVHPEHFTPFPNIKLILRDQDALLPGRFSGTGCGSQHTGSRVTRGPRAAEWVPVLPCARVAALLQPNYTNWGEL